MSLTEEDGVLWGDLIVRGCVKRADPTAVQVRRSEVFQEANKCIVSSLCECDVWLLHCGGARVVRRMVRDGSEKSVVRESWQSASVRWWISRSS